MDDIRMKYYTPVVTGKPSNTPHPASTRENKTSESKNAFQSILKEQLDKTSEVSFSKHAVKRAVENNIELTDESIARLNRGVQLASQKNLEDPLILVGGTAFLVNVRNNTVITAVGSNEVKGNVFTNIDGTVIV